MPSGRGRHPLPLAQQGSSSPAFLPAPPKAKAGREPGSQLQGREAAGSCPGLTPNHAAEGGPPGRSCPGDGGARPLGKPVGLERPASFCQWSS